MKRVLSGVLFSFLLFFSSQAWAIASGSTTNGSVTIPGTPVTYTISGTIGQDFMLFAYNPTLPVQIQVFRPDGSSMGISSDRYSGEMDQNGTYNVEIYFTGSSTGSFTLYYVRGADTVSDGTITSGATTSSSLSPNELKSYQFNGTTGQHFKLYAIGASGAYNMDITVFKPDGSIWAAATGQDRVAPNAANPMPATGTYTVVLTGRFKSDTGNYNAYFVKGGGTVSDGSLTSGGSATSTLPLNGLKSYEISGSSGQGVNLNLDNGFSGDISVYKPDGSFWASSNTGRFQGFLPANGTYVVIVSAQYTTGTGAYTLYYVRATSSVSAKSTKNGFILSGHPYTVTLPPNGMISFKFKGTAGQDFAMGWGASFNTEYRFYKPDGTNWGSAGLARAVTGLGGLPANGDYTLVIMATSTASTGPITFYLGYGDTSNDVSEGRLFSGKTRSQNLPLNGIDTYRFAYTTAQSFSITTSASFGTRKLRFVRPNGVYQGMPDNTWSGTLPVSGDWLLMVYGDSSAYSGTYTITITTTQPAVTATTAAKSPMPKGCPVNPSAAGIKAQGTATAMAPNATGAPIGSPSPTSARGGAMVAGNPINFDVGYKIQVDTDYNAAGLAFTRIYRSDSTWTDNTVGTYWRHNYARTLTVPGSTASMTDGSGATVTYTLSGSDWIPDDASNTSKFETITGGYKYTLHDGTVEKYNSSKLLTRIEYQGGGALTLAYNGSNQLTSVTNENGRQLQLTYSSGRVATLVTPDGTFSYSYTSGNLVTVTRPDTKTTTYHYENGTYVNALTGITDAKGVRYATFAYNGSGKATSTEHAGSVDKWQMTYNTNDSTVKNPLLKDTNYLYANILGVRRSAQVDGVASTNCPASNRYINYDTLGRIISMTDWENNVTRYDYDERSNVMRITEAYNTTSQRITDITWDTTFNLPDVVSEPGLTTDFDYDVYGRITSMTETDTATSATRVTAYTYHSNGTDGSGNVILGRLDEIDGPRTDVSDVTSFDYDGNYNLTKITNPLGQETEITARDAAGRPTTVEDPNNTEIDLVYDTNGWLDTATRAPGTGLQAVYDFDYDFNGNLTKVTLPNSVFVEYTYDNAQRLTGIEDSLGNTVTYTLNNAGNATKVEVKNTTPAQTYVHNQTFDELMRLLTSVGAATPAQTATYGYDKNSNLTSYTDPKTNVTSYTYDPLVRLKTSTNALSGVTTLGYTGLDDVNSVTDQRSHSTTYTYNAFGDVVGEVSPDRGTLSYTVDKAGNVTQRTDGNSVVTNFTYDALDRPLTVAYPADSSLDVTLTYDASSGCGTAYKGRLCSVVDATGTATYVYDILGRVTSVSENRGGGLTLATSYTYDLAGNIATITLPSGRVVTYTRNANGLVSNVAAPINGSSVNLASSITYLPFGPLNALTYGNSLTLSATFDTDYNPTNRTISGGIANWTYTTDKNSNVTQAGATTYGYDALNRVNAENAGAATSYTYDATDNRLTKVQGSTTTTTVPSTSNKISAVGGTSYTYDSAGNITAIGTNGYVWSAAGLMKEYKISGTSTATYTYNAFNQRTKKVTGGTTTHYVYGAGGLLYGEYTTAGVMNREYVYLNGQPLAQVTAGSPETVAYIHVDHLGTPRFATNSAGTQVWSWNNDAFGTSTPTATVTVNLRMPGQYYDSESGLFYNWNRYYNPAIGRYISSDPIGLLGGLNTFSYVGQNPVNWVDPSGEFFFIPLAFAAGIIFYADYANAPDVTGDIEYQINPWGPLTTGIEAASGAGAVKVLGGLSKGAFRKGAEEACPVGITAQNGTKVTGFTEHGIDRAIGDAAKRAGTKPQAILDALKNPNKIVTGVDSQGRPFQIFIGNDARVVVNPQTGNVVSVNPLSGAGAQ